MAADRRAIAACLGRTRNGRRDPGEQRRLAKAFRNADRTQNERIATYFDWIDPLSRNHLLSSGLRAQLMDRINRIPLLESVNRLPPGLSALDRMLYLEQKHFLPDHNLNYTDKMSMAEGVEVRVPFLDPDLVAFAWSLPDAMKHRNGRSKWILKKAMEPLLPAAIVHRPKVGFGAPLRRWLHHELRHLVQDHLSDEKIRARGLFDVGRRSPPDQAGQKLAKWTALTRSSPCSVSRSGAVCSSRRLEEARRAGPSCHAALVLPCLNEADPPEPEDRRYRARGRPCPRVGVRAVADPHARTLVSAGTERMLVEFGKPSLIDKARQQPDKVRHGADKVRTDGLMPTLDAVRNKLDQPLPLGYCNVGVVIEVGAGVTGFAVGDRVVSQRQARRGGQRAGQPVRAHSRRRRPTRRPPSP